MNHVTLQDMAERLAADEASVPAVRRVHRAVAELKRGTPVVLRGAQPLLVLPA